MRVLICGDRHWYDYALVKVELEEFIANIDAIEVVIEGGAHGADFCGKMAAVELFIPVEEYPADWEHDGKRGGPIRNKRMLEDGKPDYILAFHDDFDNSKGTASMIRLAEKAGVPYTIIKHDIAWQPNVTVHEPPKVKSGHIYPSLPTQPTPASPTPYLPKPPWSKDDTYGEPWVETSRGPRKYWSKTDLPAVSKNVEEPYV